MSEIIVGLYAYFLKLIMRFLKDVTLIKDGLALLMYFDMANVYLPSLRFALLALNFFLKRCFAAFQIF